MRHPENLPRSLALAVTCSALVAASCSGANTEVTPGPSSPPPDQSVVASASSTPPPSTPPKPGEPTTLAAVGLSAEALDKTVDPCNDFYQFACGGWIKATEIPSDKARWTRSFSEIDKRNEEDLKKILEADIPKKAEKSEDGKLGSFYAACMDTAAIEKAGTKPVKPLLDAVRSVHDEKSLEPVLAKLHQHAIWSIFDVENSQDAKDATKMIAVLDQNGLGLPDRDYYLSSTPEKQALRAKYVDHVAAMLKLGGMTDKAAAAAAQDVLAFETKLATIQKPRDERRDPVTMYNKVDRDGLKKQAPGFDWDAYFKDIGFPAVTEISITSPKYFAGIDDILKASKPSEVQNYLTWQILHHSAGILTKAFEDENFKLAQVLTGAKTIRDRWKRCVDATDSALGELLAKPFVALRFGGESKAAAEGLVQQIAKSFDGRVGELDWMDQATRDKAREKLKAMAYLIGYPAKWKVYDFPIGASYGENALGGAGWHFRDDIGKIGKPVDRGEWQMTPPTVNAYYDPQLNHMVFPAGILQPPFFDAKSSIPVNLGAMGMVVGHELTHGFDDEGSQYDLNGNLANWWTPSVGGTFKDKGQCVADQYSGYEVLPGVRLNGKLTLGENIADVGGMKLAFRAYRALRASSPTQQIADGYTEDQQFFIATGQIWCSKVRDEEATRLATVDPHSAPRFRVDGPMSQLPEFAEAFKCQAGAKMVSPKRCSVW